MLIQEQAASLLIMGLHRLQAGSASHSLTDRMSSGFLSSADCVEEVMEGMEQNLQVVKSFHFDASP